MSRPEGLLGPIFVDLRGHDVRTDGTGKGRTVDHLEAVLVVDLMSGCITEVEATAASRPLDDLVGVGTRGGFGRRLAELFADEQMTRPLVFSALEDLGGALLVSGYTLLHAGVLNGSPDQVEERAAAQADVCAGWIDDGAMIGAMRHDGVAPLPVGPPAPAIENDDALGWHPMAPLEVASVRRRRRLDVVATPPGRAAVLQSHFRDSFAAEEGERVMHEYVVDASLDETGVVDRVTVEPHVLPWHECPGAVASAQRAVGVALADLPDRVRADLVGPSTCTHLTSTLRLLADARALEPSIVVG